MSALFAIFLFRRLWSKVLMFGVFLVFIAAVMPGGVTGLLTRLGVNTGASVRATVVRINSANSIAVLDFAGTKAPVKLLGVDAPSLKQCWGREATNYVLRKLTLEDVRLVTDTSTQKLLGRRLQVYVYYGNGFKHNFNRELLSRGYARLDTRVSGLRLQRSLERAQAHARAHRLGLWGACPGN